MSQFRALNKKSCLLQIQIFLWLFSFSNLLRKVYILCISEHLSVIVIFLNKKREVFSKFPPKCYKTTGKHTLAVCGPFCREKRSLLIFVPFYWFDQKKLFKQIQISYRIFPISNLLRKTNFMSISVLLSEIVTFWLNGDVLSELDQKFFKSTENHCLAVTGSLWGNFIFYF